MLISARTELDRVTPCVHGSIGDRELASLGLPSVIDFSVNCNPLGMSPAAARAMVYVDPSHYPDDQCLLLRRALAARHGLQIENVGVGNGSAELIWLLAAAFLRPNDTVLILGPTFGEYVRAANINAAHARFLNARETDRFSLDVAKVSRVIRQNRPRLVFLCNPNNPTGLYLNRMALAEILAACTEGLLVVDEAYLSFVTAPDSLIELIPDGAVLLRSMTKDYGLAGLRLGYALAEPQVISALEKVRPPWNVNALAQAAGLASLSDEQHLQKAKDEVIKAKDYLVHELSLLGFEVVLGAANFMMVKVGNASGFRHELLQFGFCVRDCTSFGLPEYVRIGLRTEPECRQLVKGIGKVIGER